MDLLTEIMKYVAALGAAGGPIFAILFAFERSDRKKAETENRALVREVVEVVTGVEKTLNTIGVIIGSRRAAE